MTNLSDLPFITPEDIGERAMEAIAGGRGITASLARFVDQIGNGYEPGVRAILAGEKGPRVLRELWVRSIDPSIGWESYARYAAATGEHRTFAAIEYGKTKAMTLAQAEAMLDWPIYRAAILQAALEPILFADGPDTQWSPDTIEDVARLISPPASPHCPNCGHPLVDGEHNPNAEDPSCATCDELAGVGQYAPCQSL